MFVDTSFCIDLMREHSRGMTDGPALSKLRELGNIPQNEHDESECWRVALCGA
jgi:hypothetical protein